MRISSLLAVLTLLSASTVEATGVLTAFIKYTGNTCSSPIYASYAYVDTCTPSKCWDGTVVECPSVDYFKHSKTMFADDSYVLYEAYSSEDCSGTVAAVMASKIDTCVSIEEGYSWKSTFAKDGSGSWKAFTSTDCSTGGEETAFTADEASKNTCKTNVKFYTYTASTSASSANTETSSASISGMAGRAVLVVGALGAIAQL